MTRSIRNEEVPPRSVTREPDGGYRIEERAPDPLPPAFTYGGYLRVLEGRTVCMPLAASADVPCPASSVLPPCSVIDPDGPASAVTGLTITEPDYQSHFGLSQGLNCELIPGEEIQRLWNEVLKESNQQVARQTEEQSKRREADKTKKLEMLLRLALNSGNIDMAMLLFSSLESKKANELAATLMNRMQQLQQERNKLTASVSQTGDQKQDAQNAQSVNAKVGDINTELGILQTFLQDVQARKNEIQQMTSNYIKSRHDTAMGIIRNMG